MKSRIVSLLTAAAVGAGLVSCQTISATCKQTLAQVAASPQSACLNPSGLVGFFTVGQNQSLVSPIDNWLKGYCPLAPCSNQSISAIVTNITNGCSSDLSGLGFSGQTSTVIADVQQYLPTVKKVLCLKDNSAGQLCITETLTNIEKTTGPLSVDNSVQAVTNLLSSGNGLPQSTVCTDCNKAAYNLVQGTGSIPSSASSPLTSMCGSSFIDGQSPSDISDTASTASPSSAAMLSAPLVSGGAFAGLALAGLMAVLSTFTLLA